MKEIVIALIVSAAFPLGWLLYFFTKEELVWHKIGAALRKATYFLAAMYAVFMFLLAHFKQFEWSALLFIIILLQSAFASIGFEKKKAIKASLFQSIVFLALFLALFLLF